MLVAAFVVALVSINTQAYAGNEGDGSIDSTLCEKNEYYNTKTGDCEPCSECSEFLYARARCTPYKNTVCGWCGSKSVVRNEDFLLKCRNRNGVRNKFNGNYQSKLFDELWKESKRDILTANLNDINSDEIIDIDRLPISRLLPPLPSLNEADENIETSSKSKVSLLRPQIQRWWPIKRRMDMGFAPLSGKQLFSNYKRHMIDRHKDIEDLEESQTKSKEKDRDMIDTFDSYYKEDDKDDVESAEEIDSDYRYSTAVYAFTERISPDYWRWSTQLPSFHSDVLIFGSRCLKIAAYLWLIVLSLIIYIILKWKRSQRERRNYLSPLNNLQFLTKEQCDMIHRSAENIKNINKTNKGSSVYENKIAFV